MNRPGYGQAGGLTSQQISGSWPLVPVSLLIFDHHGWSERDVCEFIGGGERRDIIKYEQSKGGNHHPP